MAIGSDRKALLKGEIDSLAGEMEVMQRVLQLHGEAGAVLMKRMAFIKERCAWLVDEAARELTDK